MLFEDDVHQQQQHPSTTLFLPKASHQTPSLRADAGY
jgi:hypothetical protein